MIHKYAEIFCWKNVSSFCSAKATHIFSAKNIRILYIESTKTVNEMTLNELVKLTALWTTGPKSSQTYNSCTPVKCDNTVVDKALKGHFHVHWRHLGPVVQSVVSLTSSLMVISLTILADSIYNILIFFCWKNVSSFCTAKAIHIFQQKISAYLRITWCKV